MGRLWGGAGEAVGLCFFGLRGLSQALLIRDVAAFL